MHFEPYNSAKTINHKILLVWVFNKAPSIHVTNIGSSLASQEIKPTNLQATRMTYSKRRREDLKLFSFLHWDKPFLKPHPQKVCHMHVKLKLQTRSQIFPTNFQNTVTHKSWPRRIHHLQMTCSIVVATFTNIPLAWMQCKLLLPFLSQQESGGLDT